MFIAVRDLAFAKGRFLLMGFVIALVAYLMTFLSGLSAGLISNNVSGLMVLPVTHIAFQAADHPTFRGSLVERSMWEGWQGKPGVRKAEPLGHTTFNGRGQHDEPLEFVLWGVRPGSFLEPPARPGRGPWQARARRGDLAAAGRSRREDRRQDHARPRPDRAHRRRDHDASATTSTRRSSMHRCRNGRKPPTGRRAARRRARSCRTSCSTTRARSRSTSIRRRTSRPSTRSSAPSR